MRAQRRRVARRRGSHRRPTVRGSVVLAVCACVAPIHAAGSTLGNSKLPSFAHPKYYKTFKSTSSVAIGDLNGGGKADLAPGAVSVLINRGGGSFHASRNYLTDKAYDIALGDFNGDRRADVVIIGGESSSVIVFMNKGGGILQEAGSYGVGNFDADTAPSKLTVGDLNDDGKPDVVTANPSLTPGPGTVSVLINKGDGTFQPNVDYRTEGRLPRFGRDRRFEHRP